MTGHRPTRCFNSRLSSHKSFSLPVRYLPLDTAQAPYSPFFVSFSTLRPRNGRTRVLEEWLKKFANIFEPDRTTGAALWNANTRATIAKRPIVQHRRLVGKTLLDMQYYGSARRSGHAVHPHPQLRKISRRDDDARPVQPYRCLLLQNIMPMDSPCLGCIGNMGAQPFPQILLDSSNPLLL